MAWTIPTQITGTTQVNQADNIIQANMDDLEDYINSVGDYVGSGLAEDQTNIVNTTSNQTITGIKTFSNGIVGNVTGVASSATTLTGLTSSVAELNILDGVTATASELNTLDGITATAAELNTLDGITATVTELNYVDGVTSSIQDQLDGKQATLVSGTNIKTINSASLIGSGDINVQPTLVSGANIKTISGNNIVGSGNVNIGAAYVSSWTQVPNTDTDIVMTHNLGTTDLIYVVRFKTLTGSITQINPSLVQTYEDASKPEGISVWITSTQFRMRSGRGWAHWREYNDGQTGYNSSNLDYNDSRTGYQFQIVAYYI